MVIKNQFVADPESTPPRGTSTGVRPAVQAANNDFLVDDPWYKNSPKTSPVSGGNAGGGVNFYGQDYASSNAYPAVSSAAASGSYGSGGGGGNIYNNYPPPSGFEEDYDNEPPLLEELGIRFDHIWTKTQAVLYLNKPISEHILDDTDLAGPLCFCLLLGSLLLLSGKVHFGYIYGFSVFGCIGFQMIISLIHPVGLDFWRTCSVLGYCLLPVIVLATFAIVLNMKGILGLGLSIATIIWATLSATRLIDASLNLTEQYWLVAYPVMLLYSCFVLITIF